MGLRRLIIKIKPYLVLKGYLFAVDEKILKSLANVI
jgi:hypothetical protein